MSSVLQLLTFSWLVNWGRSIFYGAVADSIETERITERVTMIKERAEQVKQLLVLATELEEMGDDLGAVIRREAKETLGSGLQRNLEYLKEKEEHPALPAPKKRGRPRKQVESNGEEQ